MAVVCGEFRFTSSTIRRILEINEPELLEEMNYRLKAFCDIILRPDPIIKQTPRETFVGRCKHVLKTYRPQIEAKLLILIRKNVWPEIYDYVLELQLHLTSA